MQAYLVLFSNDQGAMNVLRAKKRSSGYFFHGGEYNIPIVLSPNRQYTLDDIPVKRETPSLKINNKNCFNVANKQVKLYPANPFNVPTIRISDNLNKLEVTIYPNGIDIVNNPDQYVYPGGKANPGESGVQAAVREFSEETGINLNDKMKYTKEFTESGTTYSVTYIKVPNEILTTIVREINDTLQKPDFQDRICITPTLGKVMDDELASVENVALDTAITEMSGSHDRSWLHEAGVYLKVHSGEMQFS